MTGRIVVVLLAAAGCGRFSFDEVGDDDTETDDAGNDDAAARTYLFQDGFEGALDPWSPLNNVALNNGAPSAVEGASTLRAQASPATSSRAEVMLSRTVPDGGVFFVRGYYYVPSGFPITDLSMLEIVQAGFSNIIVISSPELGVFNQIDSSGGSSNYVVPRDQWMCIETRVGIADANGTVDVWVDSVLRYSLFGVDTYDGGIDELHTGITWAGGSQSASQLYVDDVIADDIAPIGCR